MGDYNYNYKTWSYRQPLLRYYCASTDSCILYKVIGVVMTNLTLIVEHCALPFCGRVIFLHSHHKSDFKWIFSKNVYRNLCIQVTHSICYVIKFIFLLLNWILRVKKRTEFRCESKKGEFLHDDYSTWIEFKQLKFPDKKNCRVFFGEC